jgi:trigger factor
VPESMIEAQVDRFLERTLRGLAAQGLDISRFPAPDEAQRRQVRPAAEKIVRGGLLLTAIAEKENLSVSDDEVNAAIELRSKTIGVSPDHFRDNIEKSGMLEEFKSGVLQDKIYKFIEDNAEITVEKKSAASADAEEVGKE